MKKSLYKISIPLFGILILFCSCSDWFDVSPSTDVKADELFETEEGFESALTGIYLSLAERHTYAGDMSFGLIDQLAQEYDYVPDGASGKDAVYNYETETSYGFQTKQRIAAAWQAEYNIIANCNNLLKWLDANGNGVIKNESNRKMFRGETLAIRAFCHFDLLRAWGPWNYKNDNTAKQKKSIPYRIVADNSKQPLLPAEEILTKVIEDLTAAKELLAYESDLNLKENERRFRFNYHAINALLARVYTYKGDSENAIKCAKEVIDHCGLEILSSNQDDPAMFSESICALNYYNMMDNLASVWDYGDKITTQYFINAEKFNSLFEVTSSRRDDMRAKSTAFYQHDGRQILLSKKYRVNSNEVIPLIRLPEMYYILCEMNPDLKDAEHYINLVRNKRGYSTSLNEKFTSEDSRITALNKEYRKEFYAEGQYWYFLKLHGIINLPYDSEITLSKEKFEFPLPDAEKQYGWTSDSDSESETETK
ncbi:MAG: RagB/SusD family nutrient uptake outer membrane protein [Prevotella sp.]|jgi:hypothetical protein